MALPSLNRVIRNTLPNIVTSPVRVFSAGVHSDPGIKLIDRFQIKKKKKVFKKSTSVESTSLSFRQYATGVYTRLDKLIGLLSNLDVDRLNPVPNVVQDLPEVVKPEQEEDSSMIPNLVSGFIAGLLAAFASTGENRIVRGIEGLSAGLGAALRRMNARSALAARNRTARLARRIRSNARTRPSSAVRTSRRLANLTNAGRGNIARMGALGRFFRAVQPIARRIPLIATVLTPIMEGIEANGEIRALRRQLDAGEITQAEFQQQSTERVVQGVIDTVGTLGGASAGALLGSVVPVAGTLLGGALGGLAGNALAGVVGPMIAPTIARAINSSPAQIDGLVRGLSDMLTGQIPVGNILRSVGAPDWVANAAQASYQGVGVAANAVMQAVDNIFDGEEETPVRRTPTPPRQSQNSVTTPSVTQAPAWTRLATEQESTEEHNTLVVVNSPRTTINNTIVRRNTRPPARPVPYNSIMAY